LIIVVIALQTLRSMCQQSDISRHHLVSTGFDALFFFFSSMPKLQKKGQMSFYFGILFSVNGENY
jgi:hypothetical protein